MCPNRGCSLAWPGLPPALAIKYRSCSFSAFVKMILLPLSWLCVVINGIQNSVYQINEKVLRTGIDKFSFWCDTDKPLLLLTQFHLLKQKLVPVTFTLFSASNFLDYNFPYHMILVLHGCFEAWVKLSKGWKYLNETKETCCDQPLNNNISTQDLFFIRR